MFKNFPGYNLVAKRQDDKKQKKDAENKTFSKAAKIIAVTLISLIVWCLPSDALGIPDLTLTEQRTIAIFIFASLMWLTEGIPSWATSTLVIVILLYTCSDSSLFCFVDGIDEAKLGVLIPYKKLTHASFSAQSTRTSSPTAARPRTWRFTSRRSSPATPSCR